MRASLATTSEHERDAVRAPAGSLATACRAEAASAYLARADRRVLERRVALYRQMSVSSQTAQREVGKADRQLTLLEALVERRDALVETCRHEPPGTGEIAAAAERLEDALTEARTAIGDAAERLRRTRSRGVYRSPSGEFVVLEHDSVGIEHRHHSAARSAARAHARALRLSDGRPVDGSQPSLYGSENFGGGGM